MGPEILFYREEHTKVSSKNGSGLLVALASLVLLKFVVFRAQLKRLVVNV